jgi:predicted negative regulator of RcsB-dependent stress response
VFDRSERELGSALAAAESLGMRSLAARCHLTLGDLYLRMDRRQQAASEFSAAAEICLAADMPYWLARAEQGLNEPVP